MPDTLESLKISSNPWEQRDTIGLLAALWQTIKKVLLEPDHFFSNLEIKESITEPFMFYLILNMPLAMISIVVNIFINKAMHQPTQEWQIFLLPVYIIAIFISAGVMHLIVMMFGGKGGFKGTFNVLAYGSSTGIFSIIPFLGGIVAGVWGIIVGVKGYKHVHHFTTKRAVLAYFGLFLVVAMIIVLVTAIATFNARKISASDALVKVSLRTISTAAETYATAHEGAYPGRMDDLLNANTPYLTEDYCLKGTAGYSLDCNFSTGGYSVVAHPRQPGISGTTTITITTGGKITP